MRWPRQYELVAVIGRGAASTVYRARSTPGGPDVALKVLDETATHPELLARLRDEARILRSIESIPAFVRAEPPLRVAGRWAVPLEWVPGNNAFSLLRHGAFPPKAAATVVSEVASALSSAWDHPGPEGPVRLIHRDLKPGNLQITPGGAVRILDLGIAKASLPEREALTGGILPGSLGYMAPERLRGEHLPAGDVFALGVVLRVLATGLAPTRARGFAGSPSGEGAIFALAGAMQEPDPSGRPTMSEVAITAARLASEAPGPGLTEWAVERVQPVEATDPRCGEVWLEDSVLSWFIPRLRRGSGRR